MFMPLNFLFVWLAQLLSIGVLGGGIYILYQWYERELVETSYLLIGLAMVLWSIISIGFAWCSRTRYIGNVEL